MKESVENYKAWVYVDGDRNRGWKQKQGVGCRNRGWGAETGVGYRNREQVETGGGDRNRQ